MFPLMTCQSCGIENLPTASRCDCGHILGSAARPGSRAEVGIKPVGVITTVTRLLFVAPLAGAAYGGVYFLIFWDTQKSAPQQAALAGYVLACAVIPYCLARAFAGITGKR
jgi:hypothetical protein